MASDEALTKQDDIDVAGIISALRRKLWLVILVTLITGICFFFALLTVSPRYLSTAEVLIQTKASSAIQQIQEGGNRQVDNRIDQRTVRTEVGVLGSDKIALEVIEALGLVNLSEFQDKSSVSDDLANFISDAALGRPAKDPNASVDAGITTQDVARSTALRIFRKKLEIFEVENSQVIRIEFWSTNPALARNVVAEITNRYQNSQLADLQESNNIASDFVNPRIKELRGLIGRERNAAAQFESDNQIFKTNNGSADNPGLLVNQELSEASTELSRLRAEKAAAQAKIASIRAAVKGGSSLDVIPEVLESTYIQGLRQSEIAIEGQISELSTSLLPQHPRIKALNSQLQRYRGQIRKAAQDIIKSLENNVASTRNAERKLAEQIDQLKNDQLKVNSLLVTLDGIRKKISAYEEELQQRLNDAQQVRNRADITPAAASVISPASIPDEPYFPKIVPFTVAGMVAAALLTSLAIIAVSLVTTVSNYQGQTRAEPLVEEDDQQEPALVEKPQKASALNELEGIIMNNLNLRQKTPAEPQAAEPMAMPQQANANDGTDDIIAVRYAASVLADNGRGRVVVVSPAGDAGSKTVTILARLLSKARKKVVVIDLSGGLTTMQEMTGSTELPGLFNLLSGAIGVDQAIYKDRLSQSHVISAGETSSTTPLPDAEIIGETIDIIADSYDFCIVDCGDANIDAIDLVSTDDAVIVISAIDADYSDCKLLERDLKADGYNDILQIVPDSQDVANEASVAVNA